MNGWMKPYITDKRGPSLSIVVHTTALKASPAVVLAKSFPSLVDELSSEAASFSSSSSSSYASAVAKDAIPVEPRKKVARPRDNDDNDDDDNNDKEEDVAAADAPVTMPASTVTCLSHKMKLRCARRRANAWHRPPRHCWHRA